MTILFASIITYTAIAGIMLGWTAHTVYSDVSRGTDKGEVAFVMFVFAICSAAWPVTLPTWVVIKIIEFAQSR
jgi:hypothetical protein